MRFIGLAVALLLSALTTTPASAQCTGTFPANYLCGTGVLGGQPKALPYSQVNPTGLTVYKTADYGIACNGVTDDTTAMKALGTTISSAGGNALLVFPANATCLTFASGQAFSAGLGTLFDFQAGVTNVVVQGNGATLKNNHTYTGTDTLYNFYCKCTNFYIDNMKFVQTNAVSLPAASPIGTVGVWNFQGSNFFATNLTMTGGEVPVLLSNTSSAWLDNITSTNSIYGFAANTNNNAGAVSGLTIRGLVVNGSAHDRAVFLKGVSGADIQVSSLNAASNDVLISSEASGMVTQNIKLDYTVVARTASTPVTYLTIGTSSVCTSSCSSSVFRNIDVSVNADLSGDASLGSFVKFIKSTTSSLSLTFENIKIRGKISGVPNAAGILIDIFNAADASWSGETAANISLENLYITGSSTPTFHIDFAPFITAKTGHMSVRNFWMPGNYAADNASNESTLLGCFTANWGNKTCVPQASFGGTGLFQPTAHTIPIAEGTAPFNLIGPLTTGQILVGVTGADPTTANPGQFPATATNDDAAAGKAGEYISSSVVLGSAVSLTTNTPANITSISLTAGDWDVSAQCITNTAGGTVLTAFNCSITTVSATFPSLPNGAGWQNWQGSITGLNLILSTGAQRISIASTTTVYVMTQATFTTSTLSAYGFIGARRAR